MRLWHNEKGTSLVEILVGFAVLLLVLTVFYRCVILSGNLIKKAGQMEESIEKEDESFYTKKEEAVKVGNSNVKLTDSLENEINIQGDLYQHSESGRYYWKAGGTSQ